MSQDGADRLVEFVDLHSDQFDTALRHIRDYWQDQESAGDEPVRELAGQQAKAWQDLIDGFEDVVERLDD